MKKERHNKASSSRDLDSNSNRISSEDHSEEDSQDSKKSGSKLLDALSADTELKKLVSDEVNAEEKREQLLEKVNEQSKEV